MQASTGASFAYIGIDMESKNRRAILPTFSCPRICPETLEQTTRRFNDRAETSEVDRSDSSVWQGEASSMPHARLRTARSYNITSAMTRVLGVSKISSNEEPDSWDMQRIDVNFNTVARRLI